MNPVTIGIIGLVVMILLLFSQIPIAFVMTLIGFIGFVCVVSFDGGLNLLAKDFFGIFNSYSFSVIPLFILMGEIASQAGLTSRLYGTANKWFGNMPGGLAMATIVACAAFGAVCGSTVATAALMSVVALPEMRKYNYDPSLAAGSVASGSTLAVLIPPSVPLMIYGVLTQNSIGKLFIGSIFTGLILTAFMWITLYILLKRNPQLGPTTRIDVSLKEKLASLGFVWEILILFALVMGGLFMGWFTPTEAAGVGSCGALLLALVRRGLTWQKFFTACLATTRTTAMAFMLLAGTTIFGRFLAVTRIPFELSSWIATLPVSPDVIMISILMVYGIAGCFIEGFAFFILTIPIFYPVAISLGYDPIWFGVMVTLVGIFGAVTPPVGISAYVVAGVAKDVPLETVFKGCYPFFPAFVILIALLMFFPKVVTFLPNLIH